MKIPRSSYLIALLLVLLSIHARSQCPGTGLIEDPQTFEWTYHPVTANNPEAYYSGVMEAGEATFTMNNGETLTTRAYRQKGKSYSIPGPTFKLSPGNKYVLRLHNTLPNEPLSTAHNVFKDPNAVNIHTHGLHISGESPGDDVTRVFEGGRGGDFVWDIPADHMGGTFWYHAHHHGSTYLQVSGGMFGMLIVDDANDGIPAPVAAMEERQMVFGLLDPTAAGTGGDVLLSGTLSTTWTVNGIIGGNICVPTNTWQHWRILVADRNAMLRDVEFGPECEVMVLSRDGVWRTVAPKALTGNALRLTGASRADFAIRASANSWVKMNGNIIANIHVDGPSDPTVHPFDTDGVSTWSANRPDYLRDLRGETNVNFENVSMGARTVSGSKYDHHDPNYTLPTTQVQEWSLSGNARHPFHLHVYHVQALEDDRDFEAGEYYDVVASQMSVRFDLNASTSSPYSGRTIMHCHILAHEDQGAMGWLKVEGGAGPPTFPADGDLTNPYSDYYVLGGTPQAPASPSNLIATAVSAFSIDLTWVDNASDEDGFTIERSMDGVNFNAIGTVGADVTTYGDAGLNASTTYHYRVIAFNTTGNSAPSNVANATTFSLGGGTVMHVENITVTREAVGGSGSRFRGVATVTVFDDAGAAVSGATTSGNFSGPSSGNVSGTTDANGQVSFNSSAKRNPSGEWCFEVANLALSGATYDAAANVVTLACESGPMLRRVAVPEVLSGIHATDLRVYPNPFRHSTQISFELSDQSDLLLEVYNVVGKKVALITDKNHAAGQHVLNWAPSQLGSGIYLLKLSIGQQVNTQRFILSNE